MRCRCCRWRLCQHYSASLALSVLFLEALLHLLFLTERVPGLPDLWSTLPVPSTLRPDPQRLPRECPVLPKSAPLSQLVLNSAPCPPWHLQNQAHPLSRSLLPVKTGVVNKHCFLGFLLLTDAFAASCKPQTNSGLYKTQVLVWASLEKDSPGHDPRILASSL